MKSLPMPKHDLFSTVQLTVHNPPASDLILVFDNSHKSWELEDDSAEVTAIFLDNRGMPATESMLLKERDHVCPEDQSPAAITALTDDRELGPIGIVGEPGVEGEHGLPDPMPAGDVPVAGSAGVADAPAGSVSQTAAEQKPAK